MFTIPADLDLWADWLKVETGLALSSDPGVIAPPTIYLHLPSEVSRGTLTALEVTVPVWVLTDLAGKAGRDEMLTMLGTVLEVLGASAAGAFTARPGSLTVGGAEWRGYVVEVSLMFSPTE